MKIQELPFGARSDFMFSILESFDFPKEKRDIVTRNFDRELAEIGTNRVVFLGLRDHLPMSVVQLVMQNVDNNPELANGTDTAHVHNLWVRKDQHRQGLAESIMRYCENFAFSKGIKFLTLGVDNSNQPAISLYEKLGYLKFAEEPGRTANEKFFLMKKTLGMNFQRFFEGRASACRLVCQLNLIPYTGSK